MMKRFDRRVAIVTGGGTGTHRIDAGLGIFTELQVGSYIFMDDEYLACDLTGEEGAPIPFDTSLMIDTSAGTSKTMSSVEALCTTAPFSLVSSRSPLAPGGSSSAVTNTGPNAPVASKFLPMVHWVVLNW